MVSLPCGRQKTALTLSRGPFGLDLFVVDIDGVSHVLNTRVSLDMALESHCLCITLV